MYAYILLGKIRTLLEWPCKNEQNVGLGNREWVIPLCYDYYSTCGAKRDKITKGRKKKKEERNKTKWTNRKLKESKETKLLLERGQRPKQMHNSQRSKRDKINGNKAIIGKRTDQPRFSSY